MKITYSILTLSISLVLASCGSKDQKSANDGLQTIPVTINQVASNDHSPFLVVSGKVLAKNSANLSTRTMGFVNSVPVNIGDKVQKGQLLVAINNADLQAKQAQVNASIIEATAAFNNAEKDYYRFKNLFAENSASQKELDDITAHFEMAKARLEAAKQMKNEINAQFDYTNIKAPFSGVVTHKTVKKGDMANPGQPLISIEAPGEFEVMALVPETEISQITKGTQVDVSIKSINATITGKVTEVSTSASQTGGQYLVKIDIDETKANLLSGMFTAVRFPIEKKEQNQMVLVPTEAIVTQGQLSGIYTVSQNNTAILRWLRLGRTFGNDVEVLSGLNTSEAYIVSAEGKLYNGVKVSIQ
ncbi:efflux RND transporter periplasmic adaptor subunit [Aestuariivivens insulae]|uniref:efflux RND transporter periplasmic adaptor subunit n=1 Tax=Aestuariivivens insulae TaxID=1621988 RepID=UPI001F5823E3|nr:efflux RND transporter periplasmic adaptor subunit [Aestuariivivens insulae]